jgi:hypothetical protein
VKTNDISNRIRLGEVDLTIEFGRPGVGVWFYEIQKMCDALARAGVSFEKKESGDFTDVRCRNWRAEERHPERFSCDGDGEEHVVAPILQKLGYSLERAKTNIGVGRITNVAAGPAAQIKVLSR